ncbi:MAG: hypothetical protein LBN34_05740 [Clostridiales Family XIII bacterium]|nr:hypothetical protein [Clostridiales Family XIII bacterium]
MFSLTDEVIENTISSTSGMIVTSVSESLNIPISDVSEQFLASNTFALLRDKETGYYWDSIGELIDMFLSEISK